MENMSTATIRKHFRISTHALGTRHSIEPRTAIALNANKKWIAMKRATTTNRVNFLVEGRAVVEPNELKRAVKFLHDAVTEQI